MNNDAGIILYDYFACAGGAERLTLVLANALAHAELCVGYQEKSAIFKKELAGLTLHSISTQTHIPPWRVIKLMRAFKTNTRFISDYPWALYSGVAAPMAVTHRKNGPNFLYCHTIPRFAYDLKDYYMDLIPAWQRPALNALISYVRPRYEAALSMMDGIVSNSKNTQSRLKKYIGADSTIVHPPCETDTFKFLGQNGYYLSTARLEAFKRVDIIVDAFKEMPEKKLVVASGGTEYEGLKKKAWGAKNIIFTGWADEEKLREWMGNAIATIYIPMDEDFGMSPVESMAAGKPVIGSREGGLLETVKNGETGILTKANPTKEDVIEAVGAMTPGRAMDMRQACQQRAKKFRVNLFVEKMRKTLGLE